MLDVEELLELEDNIRKELDDHLPAALSMTSRLVPISQAGTLFT